MPQSSSIQYVLSWFVGETIPPDIENGLDAKPVAVEPFPDDLTISERVAMEPKDYEPVKHADTGVDADELLYESYLLPIEVAARHLRTSVQAQVILQGWELIRERMASE